MWIPLAWEIIDVFRSSGNERLWCFCGGDRLHSLGKIIVLFQEGVWEGVNTSLTLWHNVSNDWGREALFFLQQWLRAGSPPGEQAAPGLFWYLTVVRSLTGEDKEQARRSRVLQTGQLQGQTEDTKHRTLLGEIKPVAQCCFTETKAGASWKFGSGWWLDLMILRSFPT